MVESIAATTPLRTVVLDIEVTNRASLRLALSLGAERREPERVELDRFGDPRTLVVFILTTQRRKAIAT